MRITGVETTFDVRSLAQAVRVTFEGYPPNNNSEFEQADMTLQCLFDSLDPPVILRPTMYLPYGVITLVHNDAKPEEVASVQEFLRVLATWTWGHALRP